MRFTFSLLLMIFLLLLSFVADLLLGSVNIPLYAVGNILFQKSTYPEWSYIFWEMRLPIAITAILVGSALALSGVVMQTIFRNPLADAGILGISGGAGLGVAIFMMGENLLGKFAIFNDFIQWGGMILFSIGGAILILLLIASVSYSSRDTTKVLIIGVMLSFLVSSLVSLLQYFSPSELVKGFQIWSFGSLENISIKKCLILSIIILPILITISLFPKALNALLLDDSYARSLGIDTKQVRRTIIILTGILAGTITAFVGPIAFIGIAVPHIIKLLIGSNDHRKLMPLSIFGGALIMLLCHIISHLPHNGMLLPINVVTSIVGAPIVIAIIFSSKTKRTN